MSTSKSEAIQQRLRQEASKARQARQSIQQLEAQRQYYLSNQERLDNDNDNSILSGLDIGNLKSSDISKIDQIRDARVRSRLQHEYNLQTSGFYKNVVDVNKPTPDDLVYKALDVGKDLVLAGLNKIPTDAKNLVPTIAVSEDPNSVKSQFNRQYRELVSQYPELGDGSYQATANTQPLLEGGGIIDWIKKSGKALNQVKQRISNVSNKWDTFNNTSSATLAKYGDWDVVSIQVFRKPIANALDTVINVISLGKWSQLKSQYNFDKLFHLGMWLTLKDASNQYRVVEMEKVEAIMIRVGRSVSGADVEVRMMKVGQPFTLKTMVDTAIAKVGAPTYFGYSGLGTGTTAPNNCQWFLKYNLEAVGLFTPTFQNFIFQDVEDIAKGIPEYAKRIMDSVTDLGKTASILSGAGKIQSEKVKKTVKPVKL
jgi:hypothetical protein